MPYKKKMYIMGPCLQAPVTKKNKKCRQVRNCNLMGRSLQAPVSLPLACFENGYLCSLAKDCDTCIDKGCGWCASEEYEGKAGGGMYVCMYVCMYVYVYMYIYIYIYIHTYTHVYVYVYVCMYTRICICICMYVCMYIRIYVCMYV